MVRAKLRLNHITVREYGMGIEPSKVAHFDTVYDSSIPEDMAFCKATPSGHIEMQITNPAALAQLIPGKQYYVDFSPAE